MTSDVGNAVRRAIGLGIVVVTGLVAAGCSESTGPVKPATPPAALAQTAMLQNYVDIAYSAKLTSIAQATRRVLMDGVQLDSLTKTITGPSYADTLTRRPAGQYCFVLQAPRAASDSTCVTVPVYPPTVFLQRVPNLYTDDTVTTTIDSVVSQNPEANPVTVTGVVPLDSVVQPTLSGNQLRLVSRDSVGPYSVGINTRTAIGTSIQIVVTDTVLPYMIAFSSPIPAVEADQVYTVNSDGTLLRKLTPSNSQSITPAWSHDAKKIAFESSRTGPFSVFTMNADGGNQVRLVSIGMDALSPSWSPDDKQVVFVYTDFTTVSGIGLVNADGTGFVSVYEEPFSGEIPYYPRFSPDGTKIAFETSSAKICIMNRDGSNRTLLVNDSYLYDDERWLPDGTGLYLVSNRDGGRDIYRADLLGTFTRVTNLGSVSDVDVFPTGRKLVFSQPNFPSSPLYVINSDGSGRVETIPAAGQAMHPAVAPIVR